MNSLSSVLCSNTKKRHVDGSGAACRLERSEELCNLCITAVIDPMAACNEIRFIEGAKLSNGKVWTNSYDPLDRDIMRQCTIFIAALTWSDA